MQARGPAQTRRLVAETVTHWKTHLPEMTAKLEREGRLEKAATEAVDEALNQMERLTSQGIPWVQAWEMTREEYLFLPAEEGEAEEGEAEEELASGDSYQAMMLAQTAQRLIDKNLEEESTPLVTTTKSRTSPTSGKAAPR